MLLETMVFIANVKIIIKKLGYQFYELVPTFKQRVGIWILWNLDNVELNVVVKESRRLHAYFYEKLLISYVLSTICAPA